jgi:uncharacterized SAM-binding protein YcdF (DUF218 family)
LPGLPPPHHAKAAWRGPRAGRAVALTEKICLRESTFRAVKAPSAAIGEIVARAGVPAVVQRVGGTPSLYQIDEMVKGTAPISPAPPGRRRGLRRNRRLLLIATGLFVALAWMIARAGSALLIEEPVAQPDAIISLGSHEWERLPVAARLAAEHPNALVILTNPPVPTRFNCHDCAHRVDRLRHMGVAESRVRVLPILGAGTYGEARAAAAFASDSRLRRLVIVTSPYHTRRSLALFKHVLAETGIEVGIAGANVEPPIHPTWWWLRPYDRAYVPYEWAAILFYAWEYGVPLSPRE